MKNFIRLRRIHKIACPEPLDSARDRLVEGWCRETKVIRVNPSNPETNLLKEAAQVLKRGGLVAFPTDTVYGLGVSAFDEKALKKLFTVKKRPLNKPLIVLIDDAKKLELLVALRPRRTTLAKKLREKFWPGPLSLILPQAKALPPFICQRRTVGVRIPNNKVALKLFKMTQLPLATTSANLSGRLSPVTASQVLVELKGKIDLLIDGGPTILKTESTVLDLTKIPPVALREGALSVEEINQFLGEEGYEFKIQIPNPKPQIPKRTANSTPPRSCGAGWQRRTTKVLFVCTGNTCRSPMAAALFKKYLKEKLGEKAALVKVSSAGIAAIPGAKVPPLVLQVMRHRGIDLSSHRAQVASSDLLREADFIVTLGKEHSQRLIELELSEERAKFKKKIFPLEILDPIGMDYQFYEECVRELEKALHKILNRLFPLLR